jgi:hypothetical protein
MRRFYWDYYGPMAAGTAAHFHRHLDEFITARGLEGCRTGVETLGPTHSAAFCDTPEAHDEVVLRSLRPKRAAPLSSA